MNLGPYKLNTVHHGRVPEALWEIPAESVHCVVTSPPYWGLRMYDDVEPQEWADGSTCLLGFEDSPEAYVAHLVECFRAVHRVLRCDGTLWLNMGDCHATGASKCERSPGGGPQGEQWKRMFGKHAHAGNPRGSGHTPPNRMPVLGLKPKDLVGMPWRVALALQADGWYLRSDIIWHKPSPMPESANDRPTRAHEYVFLLSKSEKYFFDAFAVREPSSWKSHPRGNGINPKAKEPAGWDTGPGHHHAKEGRYPSSKAKEIERAFNRKRKTEPRRKQNESFSSAVSEVLPFRNIRTVWSVASSPCKEAHFATFPPKLVIPMIKAGTSEHGVCRTCGAQYERIVEKTAPPRADVEGTKYSGADERMAGRRIRDDGRRGDRARPRRPRVRGERRVRREDRPEEDGIDRCEAFTIRGGAMKNISGTKEWSVESVNCVTGCSHDCRYCYARFNAVQRRHQVKPGAWSTMVIREKDVRKKRKKVDGTVMFPTTHDITPEVLEPCMSVLEKLIIPGNKVLVVTKPHLFCVEEICRRFAGLESLILFRFTIGTMREAILEYWEPGAPCFSERLRCLIYAYDHGFETSVSAEPLLDKFGINMMVEVLAPFVTDAIWIGKMNQVRSRVKIETARDEEMVKDIEWINRDAEIKELYEILGDNPKVKWKDSIKKVVGIPLSERAGEDK